MTTRTRFHRLGPAAAWSLAVLGACSDVDSFAPPAVAPHPVTAVVVSCRVQARAAAATCASGEAGVGSTAALAAQLALERAVPAPAPSSMPNVVTVGGAGTIVELTLDNVALSGDTLLVMTAALTNKLDQPMGLLSTGLADPDGIRLGIVGGPSVIGGGTATIIGAEGTENFGAGAVPFVRVNGPLLANQTQWRDLRVQLAGGANEFTFQMLVRTSLFDETPARLAVGPVRVQGVSLAAEGGGGGCVITDTLVGGTVYCWGGLGFGIQGGSGVPSTTAPIAAGGPRFTRLFPNQSIINSGLCGLRVDGALLCWGSAVGPFAATASESRFRREFPGVGVREMAFGNFFACVVDAAGAAYCAGSNDYGQLGNGGVAEGMSATRPTRVVGVPRLRAVTAGGEFACGLSQGRAVYCWGNNAVGQVGVGSTAPLFSSPALVTGLADSVMQVVATQESACALTQPGDVWCWGHDPQGEVGAGGLGNDTVRSPVRVVQGGASSLAAGARHVCMRLTSGIVQCWGDNRARQAGQPTGTVQVDQPTAIDAGRSYVADTVIAGGAGSCFREAGVWTCFGSNFVAELGLASPLQEIGATPVPGFSGLTSLTLSPVGGCGLLNESLQCWGFSNADHFPASPVNNSGPIGIGGRRTFVQVARSTFQTCARRASGSVYCWGLLPAAVERAAPESLATDVRFRTIGVSHTHACGISLADSTAWCWGNNTLGSLGVSAPGASPTPVQVSVTTRFTRLAVGFAFTCAMDVDGAPWCWGQNDRGQLGRGSATSVANPTPVRVGGGNVQLANISAGDDNVCGATALGEVLCWGGNRENVLGIGAEVPFVTQPVVTASTIRARQGSLGSSVGCALTVAGVALCNGTGSLGSATVFSGTLVRVQLDTPLRTISVGSAGGCGIDFSDRLWCWGNHGATVPASNVPVLVPIR